MGTAQKARVRLTGTSRLVFIIIGLWSSFIHPTSQFKDALHDMSYPPLNALLISLIIILFGYVLWRHKRYQSSVRRLTESSNQLHHALWGSVDGLWEWNIQSGEVSRQGLPDYLGYKASELQSSVAQLLEIMHPDDTDRVYQQIEQHLSGSSSHFHAEYRVLSKQGDWRWIQDKGKIVERDIAGNPVKASGTQTDITDKKHAENELRLAAEVIQSMNEAVILIDKDCSIRLVNHAFSCLMGFKEDSVIGTPLHQLFSPRDQQHQIDELLTKLNLRKGWQGELWQRSRQGQDLLTSVQIKPLAKNSLRDSVYVVIFSDITEKKRAEDKLLYLANYDTLTGLPNRALFHQRLSQSLEQAQQDNIGFSIVCVDLDHFKTINDSLGHFIGDQLLQRAALVLKRYMPISNATIARLAGDEFTLLLPGYTDRKALETFSFQLLESFKIPIEIEHHEITISPSIGICRYPEDGQDSMTLLRNAENALHFAKASGRHNFQFYNEDIQTSTLRKLMVGNHLRRALENGELELVYQPKINIANQKLEGMEALLRWNNTEIGAIEPDEFIAIAEETGLVNDMGFWVLKEACHQARLWQLRGSPIVVSVNISAVQFKQANLYKTIANVLAQYKLEPSLLELEITETMLMRDPELAITTLSQLKEMGVKIAVDDFGTGYSSLSYLKNLPIDTLKIDRAFISDVTKNDKDAAITLAIITLANNLNLNVIAEGVETEAQLNFLRQAGCEQAQGFLIAEPMTARHAQAYCQKVNPKPSSVSA